MRRLRRSPWQRRAIALLSLGASSFAVASAYAAEHAEVRWLPGDARRVSRSSSASRDTAAVEAILAPRFAVTLGSEFGLVAWRPSGVTLRVGALALFGLESRTRSARVFPAPGGDSNLWRGILAYELALSFDDVAAAALGPRGALEVAAGYYHESDHHTASNDPAPPGAAADGQDLRGRPQIGNYLASDFAARFLMRSVELTLRHESKLFVNGAATTTTPFRAATGDELVLELHDALPGVTPFWSTAAEVLLAKDRPAVRYFRSLLGLALPGAQGELRVYASFDTGAQKGLLIPEQQTAFGAGLRYTPFDSGWP